MRERHLTALPVFNEAASVPAVIREVLQHSSDVLVVDDGSTDETPKLLKAMDKIRVVRHQQNLGYGAALRTAFEFAAQHNYTTLVTIDCDGQHEPQRIPRFVSACRDVDIVSGSRYLKQYDDSSTPPAERRWINHLITNEINQCLGFKLTDAFCGFKAYRVAALRNLHLVESGYAMPLELWVEAAAHRLQVLELPVPLIYLDEKRSFGGALDDGQTRLNYYRDILKRSLSSARRRYGFEPAANCGDQQDAASV